MDTVRKRDEIISIEQRSLVSQRYRRITRAVNSEFWGNTSETAHSLYVGSYGRDTAIDTSDILFARFFVFSVYGRDTAIDTSDIDILVELPRDEYNRYDALRGNGQSRLLQALKNAILQTYPRSDIHGDGQVVVINFTDGMKFEVLPAFHQLDWWGNWNGKYDYPDSNMGGNWLTTDPKSEQQAMKEKNVASNGLLFDTCKHMREIRDNYFRSYHLPGIVIDSFVYHNISDWHWLREGEQSSNQPIGTYEKRLYDSCPFWSFNLTAPGNNMPVDTYKYIDALIKVLKYMSKE